MRQLRSERDRGNIPTARERVAGADRTEKFAIEILRIVIAETARRVFQQSEWMNSALIERERVENGFKVEPGERGRRVPSTCP